MSGGKMRVLFVAQAGLAGKEASGPDLFYLKRPTCEDVSFMI